MDHDGLRRVRVSGAEELPFRCIDEVCPRCGKANFRETCIGAIDTPDAPKPPPRDPNKRTCMECGAQWYAAQVVTPSTKVVGE